MDQKELSLKKECSFRQKRGVAFIMAFSVTILVLGLIVSLYWTSVQRHTLMRKRAEHSRRLFLVEAGVNDAIARLRMGNPPAVGINPAVGRWYCLDVETGSFSDIASTCSTTCTAPLDVRVCVSNNCGGTCTNQIDVTAEF